MNGEIDPLLFAFDTSLPASASHPQSQRVFERGGIGVTGLVILIIVLVWLFGGGGFHLHD